MLVHTHTKGTYQFIANLLFPHYLFTLTKKLHLIAQFLEIFYNRNPAI